MKIIKTLAFFLMAGLWLQPGWALADDLVAMDDSDLSEVDGQDGLTLNVNANASTGITMSQINYTADAGTANAATLRSQNLSLLSVNTAGTVSTVTPAHAKIMMDAGPRNAVGGDPFDFIGIDLDRTRLAIGRVGVAGDTAGTCGSSCSNLNTRSYGDWALDAEGRFRLVTNGAFSNTTTNPLGTYLYGSVGTWNGTSMDAGAKLFYRQVSWNRSPYLVMNNLLALWELKNGELDASTIGIRQATKDNSWNFNSGNVGAGALDTTSILNVALDTDFLYKYPNLYSGDTTNTFLITGNEQPLMHFGWKGAVRNAELYWRPGGTWSVAASPVTFNSTNNTYDLNGGATFTKGLNFSSRWDYVSYCDANNDVSARCGGAHTNLNDATREFTWEFGESAGSNVADKSRVNFLLGDWVRWNPNLYSHYFPYIGIDVINAAQGAGALCWGSNAAGCAGGTNVDLTAGTVAGFSDASLNRADAKALALLVRNGNLLTYSRSLTLTERNAAGTISYTRPFKWGLIYTFANVDANAYIYAGGNNSDAATGSLNAGVILDLNLMSQTFNGSTQGFNWDQGSHMMIADTDIDADLTTGETRDAMGIGLVSTSFLVLSNDMTIRLKNIAGAQNACTSNPCNINPYTGGLDLMSPTNRFTFNTTFGGGILPDASGSYGTGPKVVKAALIRLNFEGLLNGRLSPSSSSVGTDPGSANNPCIAWGFTCKNYLGYSWAMRFADTNTANFSENTTIYNCTTFACANTTTSGAGQDFGSYLSLAEPNQPAVDVRFANITGDLTLENGVIDIADHLQDTDGLPKLRIAHNVRVGTAAATRMTDAMDGRPALSPAAGQPFSVDRIMLGGALLGKVVMPSAQIYSSLTLKPQN